MYDNRMAVASSARPTQSPLKIFGCSCGEEHYTRQRRDFWMRLIPGFRLYFCSVCNCKVLAPQRRGSSTRRYAYYVGDCGSIARAPSTRSYAAPEQQVVTFQGHSFHDFVAQLVEARESAAR